MLKTVAELWYTMLQIMHFPDWKAYNEITGLGGWSGRNEQSGPYLYVKDGE